jgi:hypothetical protein
MIALRLGGFRPQIFISEKKNTEQISVIFVTESLHYMLLRGLYNDAATSQTVERRMVGWVTYCGV